jgi:methylase of polypeptide subunit release factors
VSVSTLSGSSFASMTFDDLVIRYDATVLRPRPWTVAQSAWAAELLEAAPDGAVLELCCGAGHIGLWLVARTTRRAVLVDIDRSACTLARANADANGLGNRVEVRNLSVRDAGDTDERFALVIADPPWVPSAQTARYPDDPLGAIDGGHDGLAVARECVDTVSGCLLDGGSAVLQLGDAGQAAALSRYLGDNPSLRLRVAEVRQPPANGVLVRITAGSASS